VGGLEAASLLLLGIARLRASMANTPVAKAGTEFCALFARNMGNYAMNNTAPQDVLERLHERDSDSVRFVAFNKRRSGNFLAERRVGVSDREVETAAEAAVPLRFVCRRLDLITQLLDKVKTIPGFDRATYSVSRDNRPWKIAVSFVAGTDPLPDIEHLRSPNPWSAQPAPRKM
jgi:hypothetical protein